MGKSFIWFDLGYTLVYKPRERIYRAFLLEHGIHRTIEEIELAYHVVDKHFMRYYPGVLGREQERFFPWYLGLLNYELKVDFKLHEQYARLEELERLQGYRWELYPFVIETLERLKRNGIGLGLISNWDGGARDLLDRCGLTRLLDAIVISSEVGFEKPSQEIFRHACLIAGVTPDKGLYVGDNYYDDVVGSRAIGLDSVLINRLGYRGIEEIEFSPILASIASLPDWLNHTVGAGTWEFD
ncbi:HAD family hydrolase [Cohnella cholangitidis]|uniref:HAD-IA family hydrolase n=1 Tax=Cohnella cholangitidis TaxID=2598458 RepID=A0A7G5C1H9_9BACL|nr:HAD-IA family hydrolase [Cohnella cholangitidis]QMV43063.1 HAD-IA family hydrolase [Cohnella cholangitidis]